jgi:hypothetical protein
LRRAHFHPRKRGRKGKNDEKRGGIGGGDHPAMDWLKQYWIKETEVANKLVPASPESASDSAPETEPAATGYETTFDMVDVSKPYPDGQQQLPQIPLDYGLSASITPLDPVMYDDNNFAAYNEVNNFQFDAYNMGA